MSEGTKTLGNSKALARGGRERDSINECGVTVNSEITLQKAENACVISK